MTLRSLLYRIARILGDIRAVQTDRVHQRLVNRGIGRLTSKLLSRLWR